MNPGGWTIDTAAFPGGEIGVIHAPSKHTGILAKTGTGPGLMRLENGDIIAWSGLPLAEGRTVKLRAARDLLTLGRGLDGVFSAVGWSAEDGRLYATIDFLGLQPFYYGETPDGWMAANETKPFPYVPDAAGWGGFIAFGQTIGGSTLAHHAERLRPATALTITPGMPGAPAKVEATRYWQMPDEKPKEPATADIVATLEANTAAYQALADESVLLLSGGFDSRLILGLLHRLKAENRRALILSHYDEDADLDGRLAAITARLTDTPIEYDHPDRQFFSSGAYLDYIHAIDGGTPNLYMFIAQLSAVLEGRKAVWDGLIPPLALRGPLQTADGALVPFRHERFLTGGAPIRIFKPKVLQDMRDAFQAEFERTKTLFPDSPHGRWQWIVENRMRNRTGVNPTKVYVNHVTPLLVGSSRALWELAATIPFARRRDYQYYIDVFRTLSPELTRVPFSSGGDLHRADAPWHTYQTYALQQKGWRALARRPRLARMVGIANEAAFAPSCFMNSPALYREEDDLLDMDVVRRMETDEALRATNGKLLFHWRTTRWVHENRLHTTLLEAPDDRDQPLPALAAQAG
ncbi:hypothetical protein [Pedomonas mirosovicensis]|uniref:hypothetical protein n=1 Tax=Pedomonas mirosovicensis TaxID=2908641 RepID=UPI0021674B11|nr:hypothetical protein [Pedomonas mirosovicensis]MCH8683958.1 hypothetical protein [Pedomonas mirosovicensis]